jgi:dGTP triphosphohydrolase
MDADVCEALETLKDFLFDRVYSPRATMRHPEYRGERIVQDLFRFYMDYAVSAPFLRPHERDLPVPDRARRTADFIAGMTDHYACEQYVRHFIPTPRGEFPLLD